MALFENFPYTNLHELNLDWLIAELKKVQNDTVLSVNGQTGEVILYQQPETVLPAVATTDWTWIRSVDGTRAGIKFTKGGVAWIIRGGSENEIYSSNNPPFKEQYVQLPTLTGPELHSWNIFRFLNNVVRGIEFDENGNAFVMSGNARYKIATSDNTNFTEHNVTLPPVASGTEWSIERTVNGVDTGIVIDNSGWAYIKIGTDYYPIYSEFNPPSDFNDPTEPILEITEEVATGNQWGIVRSVNSNLTGIVFVYNQSAQLFDGYLKNNNTLTKLLTIEDIPSSSGVVSINGQTGVVTLSGSQIMSYTGSPVTIQQALRTLENGKVDNPEIAYYVSGDTATENIPKFHYVIWNHQLFRTLAAISAGETLGPNLEALPTGGLNALKDHMPVTQMLGMTVSSSQSYFVPNSSSHVCFFVSASQNYYAIVMVYAQSSGTVTHQVVWQSSDSITFSHSANTLTATGSASGATTGVQCYCMTLNGDYMHSIT